MKRQPKPFVVEIKRSSKKASGVATPPIWDVAALLSSAEADAHSKPSQIAASALFRTNSSDGTPAAPQPERRILPVVATEAEPFGGETLEMEPPRIERPRPRREVRAPAVEDPMPGFAEPAAGFAEPEIEFLAFDTSEPADADEDRAFAVAEAENVFSFSAEPASDPAKPRSRPLRERDLPRGERWKRRLPKFMR
ncbi:hypothetical protein [Labrys monachus]|uniref:Uncharacterized protein n=1 Tax=Labrys monachus TaxID=217067 RepID=A0ABU0FFZ2_9HYPH|nr:hypothetical protein [Labrys monachus]MDQ0393257.1 hypothetical protein [Labrys monachus]